MRTIVALLLAISASGCATVGESILEAGTTGDIRFKPDDVDKAIEIARAAKDAVAEACYTAIRKHVDQELRIEPVGPVSKYAAARVRVRESRAGLAQDVHTACSPLIIDAAEFARGLSSTIRRAIP